MSDLLKFTILLTTLAIPLGARDFGTHGTTFPIEEEDLVEYIQGRIQSLDHSTLSSLQEKLKDQYEGNFNKPKPVIGIYNAIQYESHYFDPTVITKEDIKDHQGNVIIQKGASYNPLEYTPLSQDLLFFDGEQEEHLNWAKSFGNQTKWILVNGKPLDLEKQENRPIFFDQFGILSKKLSIKTIPSKVTQEGTQLKIESFSLQELICAS